MQVSEGEHGGQFHICNGNRIFSEWDTEDIAFSAYTLGAQPCIIEYQDDGYERDIEVTAITEKRAADMEAAQAAKDLQQRLRFGL